MNKYLLKLLLIHHEFLSLKYKPVVSINPESFTPYLYRNDNLLPFTFRSSTQTYSISTSPPKYIAPSSIFPWQCLHYSPHSKCITVHDEYVCHLVWVLSTSRESICYLLKHVRLSLNDCSTEWPRSDKKQALFRLRRTVLDRNYYFMAHIISKIQMCTSKYSYPANNSLSFQNSLCS